MITSDELSRKEIAAMLALIVIAASTSAYIYSLEEDEETDPTAIIWKVNVVGDNYRIDIIEVQSVSLDEVSWSLIHLKILIANSWDDPAGDTLRMEGDLSYINFSQADYNVASEKAYELFYSRDPEGVPAISQNHTLFIVFKDNDMNGKLSNGDRIWIRSADNGGAAIEDHRFRMVNERLGEAYGEVILPAV